MKIDSPFRVCTERFLYCHSACPRYAEYRAKIDEMTRRREQARQDNRHGKEITISTIRQIYRKAGGRSVNIQSR